MGAHHELVCGIVFELRDLTRPVLNALGAAL